MSRWIVLGALACTSVAIAAPKRTKPGDEIVLADIGWATGTKSARANKAVDVVRTPGNYQRYGRLAAGTRVAWKRIVVGQGACKAWLEIEPRGFVCTSGLEPSVEPPLAAIAPARVVADTLANAYLSVAAKGAYAYGTPNAIRRNAPQRKLDPALFLQRTIEAVEFMHGSMYVKTTAGYVEATGLVVQPPSAFEGVELTAATPWPFAWVVPSGSKAIVRAGANKTAPIVRELASRNRVAVLEEQTGFVRIGKEEWVALADLRVAGPAKRPTGVRADERWLDVDLDHNTLVAYEGDKPVFATLVSTGVGSTPPSLHRIVRKDALRTLANPSEALGTWSFPDVPFVLEFRKYYALHSVYWHDNFGNKRGHGCVNLSPRDARKLYDFTLPHVPDGWIQGDARGDEGTPVRIRNKRNPDPKWTPWNAAPPTKTRSP